MSSVPIAAHALISDCHSAALVTDAGSIDWLCFPRFDSPSVFGRLLDETAGHWALAPVEPFESSRRYLDDTLVLETEFRTAGGVVRVTEALAMGAGNRGHELGRGSPHLLVRSVTGVAGEVTLGMTYRPRPEYGILTPLLGYADGGVTARGGAEWLVLSTPVRPDLSEATATASFSLTPGQTVAFALHRSTLEETPAHVWSQEQLARRLADTIEAWRSWSAIHQTYDGPWRDLVRHSGRVLQALTYRPSGAIVAAATTSLPEAAGGERNWDYRYSWVRDASFTMQALWVAACPDEAGDFFAFMTTAAAGTPVPLQIMFGVGGEHDLTERTLPHLRGWRDSRPVRIGNGAWEQQQIDVYGELLGAALTLQGQLTGMDDDVRRFLMTLADTAATRWREPDQGIWEVRGHARHFVYSKVMCWVALDRALQLFPDPGHWRTARAEIRETVLRDGYSEARGAFTQSFGSDDLDASVLMLPIVGFLPATDPRMRATIDAVAEDLVDPRGLVYRYRGADGLDGDEGTFLLCTFWLAQALALAGEHERATEVFERAAGYRNDVDLLAEEVDPGTGELLGNFPQAFSHIGLVNAAWAITGATRDHRGTPGRPARH
ncbi:glycoside hydrolase family 15 protein [Actinoplanes sp. CA-131856]